MSMLPAAPFATSSCQRLGVYGAAWTHFLAIKISDICAGSQEADADGNMSHCRERFCTGYVHVKFKQFFLDSEQCIAYPRPWQDIKTAWRAVLAIGSVMPWRN
jgi:hypothetical protein